MEMRVKQSQIKCVYRTEKFLKLQLKDFILRYLYSSILVLRTWFLSQVPQSRN